MPDSFWITLEAALIGALGAGLAAVALALTSTSDVRVIVAAGIAAFAAKLLHQQNLGAST